MFGNGHAALYAHTDSLFGWIGFAKQARKKSHGAFDEKFAPEVCGCGFLRRPARPLLFMKGEVQMSVKNDPKENEIIDNGHQKSVSGKNQNGPADKLGKGAGGNAGSKGQNVRAGGSKGSVGSHKPGGDGPGTKKFKHESDESKRGR